MTLGGPGRLTGPKRVPWRGSRNVKIYITIGCLLYMTYIPGSKTMVETAGISFFNAS